MFFSDSVSTPLFDLYYRKVKLPDLNKLADKYEGHVSKSEHPVHKEEVEHHYNPYRIKTAQNYSPIYDRMFVLNETNYNLIGLNSEYYIHGDRVVCSIDTKKEMVPFDKLHVKSSPLVDPFHYLSGKYDKFDNAIDELPVFSKLSVEDIENTLKEQTRIQKKINDPANSAYVDAFFSYLSSRLKHKYNVFGAVDFYGVCLGIQEVYKYDITEDLSHLYSVDFFNENIGKRFVVSDQYANEYMNIGSRANKHPIQIDESGETPIDLDMEIQEIVTEEHLTGDINKEEPIVNELIYENNPNSTQSSSDDSSSSDSSSEDGSEPVDETDSNTKSCSESEYSTVCSETEDSSSESDSEDVTVYSYIRDFPVQLIFMEKCAGTIDQLFMSNQLDDEHVFAASFMQIIMTLIVYQKAFQFTHNDLHTNNILYVETEAEFVYYKYNGRSYKVPTYGRIFKIIDFGRSIYKYNGEIYCSDSYSKGADAYGQYNCEPYFNSSKPRIDPNSSFDLARLGSSIFDFLDENADSEIYKTVKRWCTDDNGKNIVNKPNGEERWPGFKLYKMIARCVHKHTPQAQLEFPMFKQFLLKKSTVTDTKWLLDIDSVVA